MHSLLSDNRFMPVHCCLFERVHVFKLFFTVIEIWQALAKCLVVEKDRAVFGRTSVMMKSRRRVNVLCQTAVCLLQQRIPLTWRIILWNITGTYMMKCYQLSRSRRHSVMRAKRWKLTVSFFWLSLCQQSSESCSSVAAVWLWLNVRVR